MHTTLISSHTIARGVPSAEATDMANSSEYIAIILLSLAAAVGYAVFLHGQDTTKHDSREPPLIP